MKNELRTYEELLKDNKKSIIFIYILLILYLCLLTIILVILFNNQFISFKSISNKSIDFPINYSSNFSAKEIYQFDYLLNHIAPMYQKVIKKVSFVTTDELYKINKERKWLAGLNRNGYIYVAGDMTIENVANTLCHEILHNTIFLEHDLEEKIVSDLAEELPCYDNSFKIKRNKLNFRL